MVRFGCLSWKPANAKLEWEEKDEIILQLKWEGKDHIIQYPNLASYETDETLVVYLFIPNPQPDFFSWTSFLDLSIRVTY